MRTVCPCCHRSLPKKRVRKLVKKTVRKYEDGIKKYPDGRERCVTKAAWARRKDEVFARDCINPGYLDEFWRCADCGTRGTRRAFDVDHIRKRSVGRDDSLSNLRLLCNGELLNCHLKRHNEFRQVYSQPQWSKRA